MENFKDYYISSLGQSYPYVLDIKDIKLLFFTDWYYDNSHKRVLNRLIISEINDNFEVQNMHIFKSGLFSKSGATRAYLIRNHVVLFTPIFQDFGNKFPNYFIHKFEFKLDLKETFQTFIKKLLNSEGRKISTGLDKTTCFNIIDPLGINPINYDVIFAGRDDCEKYNLYYGNIDSKFNSVSNLSILKFNDSLTYPSIFSDGKHLRLICSVGRYGDKGIIFSNIK